MPRLCVLHVKWELAANHHISVLLIFKSHKVYEEDNEEAGMDDYKKSIWNPVTKFSDFVNADETTLTRAKTILKLSVQSGDHEENCGSGKEAGQKPTVTIFSEAVSSFDVIRKHIFSYKTDNASLIRPDNLGIQLLFIQHLKKRNDLHSSHMTNKVDVNPQLL